jgi:predicted Zn-dependent peptidase
MIQKHTFSNGFTLVYQKSTTTIPITYINAICDLGPIYEREPNRGLSHLIEHMCYKGTQKIPKPFDLLTKYDNYGAYINAITSKRYTMYKVNCEDQYSKHCIHLLSDIMLNSVFNKKEFEKEHQVVIEESMKDDENNEYIINVMNDALIYKNTPFAFEVDCVAYHKKGNLKYQDVVKTYREFYIPPNMILSVVSNLSFSFFVKLVKTTHFAKPSTPQQLATLQSNKQCIHGLPYQSGMQNGIQYNIKPNKKMDITHLTIAFRVCSQYSAHDKYVLDIVSNLLGGYFSSRLFTVLREENGLTYSSGASTAYTEFMGDFTLFAITDPHKLMKNGNKKGVLPIIIDILNAIIEGGITSRELSIAKHNLRGKYTLHANHLENVSIYNCEKALLFPDDPSSTVPYDKLYDTYYKDINLHDVNTIIRKYFTHNNMNVCVLGEIKASPQAIQTACEKIKKL